MNGLGFILEMSPVRSQGLSPVSYKPYLCTLYPSCGYTWPPFSSFTHLYHSESSFLCALVYHVRPPHVLQFREPLIATQLCSALEAALKSKPEKSEMGMMIVGPCSKDPDRVSRLQGNSSLQDLISSPWCPHSPCVWYVVPNKY